MLLFRKATIFLADSLTSLNERFSSAMMSLEHQNIHLRFNRKAIFIEQDLSLYLETYVHYGKGRQEWHICGRIKNTFFGD
jgi:hypothetical protein